MRVDTQEQEGAAAWARRLAREHHGFQPPPAPPRHHRLTPPSAPSLDPAIEAARCSSQEQSVADSREPTLRHPTPGDAPQIDPRYSIERELGRGVMGRVFAARDEKLGRDVAIQVLAPGFGGDAALRRFEQEARAAGSLDHPNGLTVPDIGSWQGGP